MGALLDRARRLVRERPDRDVVPITKEAFARYVCERVGRGEPVKMPIKGVGLVWLVRDGSPVPTDAQGLYDGLEAWTESEFRSLRGVPDEQRQLIAEVRRTFGGFLLPVQAEHDHNDINDQTRS